ncbi:HipA-like protein [Sphaerotilus hippei]|uniref:HipA-like protein n=1 Tax=Sphaerotilus hippei TaxID=744406 RepID=A0A318H6Q8_9BURK|nr:type II toxin-antitoxin system HipA family toxin YjjJ [Sphaerotilus hippei]PXW99565.1 HipA-like protein [Sphaerotilus hippei]
MRPSHIEARQRLLAVLRRQGPSAAAALAEALSVSRATLLRMLDEQADALVASGAARRRRYAVRRGLRGDAGGVPVHRVDAEGGVHAAGVLHLTEPEGSCWALDEALWPAPPEARDGWWSGLPYPLQDLRFQGYMGRQFARRHHDDLALPADVRDWSDDDHLWALTRAGHDAPGDLIVGEAALRRWLAQVRDADLIAEADAAPAYAALAEAAVATGVAGSSAAGEFPKFTARRTLAGADTPEVIVKFSGADDSPAVRRWADLLHGEHLALQTLAEVSDLPVARSRLLRHGGRTFLESERFDRHGPRGRRPVVSLAALDAEVLGQGHSHWPRLARALVALGWLSPDDAIRITRLHWFGRFIANTDMHTGNLSFMPEGGRLRLAPVYDMLPMRYAPLAGGEVPPLEAGEPPPPLPQEREDAERAARWATAFWLRVTEAHGLSEGMRRLGQEQARRLRSRYPAGDTSGIGAVGGPPAGAGSP